MGTVQRRVRPPGVSSILLEEGLLEVLTLDPASEPHRSPSFNLPLSLSEFTQNLPLTPLEDGLLEASTLILTLTLTLALTQALTSHEP